MTDLDVVVVGAGVAGIYAVHGVAGAGYEGFTLAVSDR
jgi:cation diffusion facilitator CzcD-associated flavoprotein CzcO